MRDGRAASAGGSPRRRPSKGDHLGASGRQLSVSVSSDSLSEGSPQLLVQVLVDGERGSAGRFSYTAAGSDTIKGLKLRLLAKKNWFTSKHVRTQSLLPVQLSLSSLTGSTGLLKALCLAVQCLVFGDRELLDNEQVSDIMQQVRVSRILVAGRSRSSL